MPAVERPDPASVVHEGWLLKKGNVNPKFKMRWCRIADGRLFYYLDQYATHPKGVIPLRGALVHVLAEPVSGFDQCFRLCCQEVAPTSLVHLSPRGRRPEYILSALSLDERTRWLREIRACVDPPREQLAPRNLLPAWAEASVPSGADAPASADAPAAEIPASSSGTQHGALAITMREDSGRKFVRGEHFEYEMFEKLGEGATSKVKRCIDTRTNEQYAIKILKKSKLKRRRHYLSHEKRHASDWDNVLREVAIMKRLQHRSVVQLYQVLDDDESDRLYLILDYLPGGPVGESRALIDALPIAELRRCMRDMASGLAYLHSRCVVHRDMKPANILRSTAGPGGRFVIADFGVSFVFEGEDDTSSGRVGTLPFKPPEAHDSKGGAFSGRRADVWSMGATAYQLAFGCLPFFAEDPLEFALLVRDSPVEVPTTLGEPLLEALLRAILVKDPAARPTASEVRQHEWLRESGLAFDELPPSNAAADAAADEASRALLATLSFRGTVASSGLDSSLDSTRTTCAGGAYAGGCGAPGPPPWTGTTKAKWPLPPLATASPGPRCHVKCTVARAAGESEDAPCCVTVAVVVVASLLAAPPGAAFLRQTTAPA